jgi:hypothetical protein
MNELLLDSTKPDFFFDNISILLKMVLHDLLSYGSYFKLSRREICKNVFSNWLLPYSLTLG